MNRAFKGRFSRFPAALLAAALLLFCLGGCGQNAQTDAPAPIVTPQPDTPSAEAPEMPEAPETPVAPETPEAPASPEQDANPPSQEPEVQPDDAPSLPEEPAAPEEAPKAPDTPEAPAALTCTVRISCASILENMELLDPDKAELVPEDGILLPETTVEFTAGETVFDVLLRVTKEHKLHLEYTQSPLYQTVYIEGIGNLYEFDCGALSGWMYSVNGSFPNYGCSLFALQDGDAVCWLYTCDQGQDVGGGQ